MSEDPEIVRGGGCRCGAVRYEARGEPNKVVYCHCESCRAATGAPVAVNVMFEQGRLAFTGREPRAYESSPGVRRDFCERCGTPVSWHGVWHERQFTFVYLATVDRPHALVPDRHAYCAHQLAWFDVADDLPRYPGTSPDGPLGA